MHCTLKREAVRVRPYFLLLAIALAAGGCDTTKQRDLAACAALIAEGLRPVAVERTERFLGKVEESTARCRGGNKAAALRSLPWVDWANYWATGDASSRATNSAAPHGHLGPNERGIEGALLDLEYQRIELIKFNLFDNSGTYPEYVRGRGGTAGPALKVWDTMRLSKDDPNYTKVGGEGPQVCRDELIWFRTLTGICNDIRNPLMGSTRQPFARNVQLEATYPDLRKNELARNRHGDRLGLLKPDPQVISRKLFTRAQSMPVGCARQLVENIERSLTPSDVARLECRPDDLIDTAYVGEHNDPPVFVHQGKEYLSRAYKTSENTVTAWWDASQIYGYDDTSRRRVKRDPHAPAKLLLIPVNDRATAGEKLGYLPQFEPSDPINPQWAGQEATAFPDNWSIGMSFYHNVFAREHNLFVAAFRSRALATPDDDSGLRNPIRPTQVIRYKDVTADELFEIGRLVVSAEIAKIHTIEWTTQLLYDEPLYLGMNANWHGLIQKHDVVTNALERIVVSNFGKSDDAKKATQWYSVFASGAGIFGLGSRIYANDGIFARDDPSKADIWSLKNPDHVNGGTNHFGSPFNFPEEFVTVYRLHALVPDLLEYQELEKDPNIIQYKIPVVETLQGKATKAMR